jgi:aspartate-semialdehyde dehydrogenase
MKSKKFAVVGATGCVGREMISILIERANVPVSQITAIASEKSEGTILIVGQNSFTVHSLLNVDFSQFDFALFSVGSKISAQYGEKAAATKCTVIDNTSFFRMRKDVPLIVPEVNFDSLYKYENQRLISNPNCSTIQMVMVLKPLHELFIIKEVVVSTYQSASGAGQKGVDELLTQVNSPEAPAQYFQKRLAFNVIPQIDDFTESSYTKEEMKMINETKKILGLDEIDITATCVRVPVIIGHSESLFVKFEKKVDIERAKFALKSFPGIYVSEGDIYMTALEAAHKDMVFVSRIRRHTTIDTALSCFVVSDNVRKGAALNAIQIIEKLLQPNLRLCGRTAI